MQLTLVPSKPPPPTLSHSCSLARRSLIKSSVKLGDPCRSAASSFLRWQDIGPALGGPTALPSTLLSMPPCPIDPLIAFLQSLQSRPFARPMRLVAGNFSRSRSPDEKTIDRQYRTCDNDSRFLLSLALLSLFPACEEQCNF
jgi:hypothetical protein